MDAEATEQDIHDLAGALPFVETQRGPGGNVVYQVGGKSFIYFRTPRKDAFDPATGEPYRDVVVFWVSDEAGKQSLVHDPATPYFTTSHFDGHPSVLLRLSRIGELSRAELAEVIEDAWLSRASSHRGRLYLASTARITEVPTHPRR
ncbi:MAG: MmcQ/YjbR family DNA-binding protein [Actinobacteria bacterium]|nr:MmcQ/YjbR family DNA-binding protein [Actinomycetota bacterium]